MKLLRLAIVLVLLCWLISSYAVTPRDLNGGDVVAQGVCQMLGDYYHCIYIEKNGKNYIAVGDGKRLRSIYSVKEWKETYTPDEMTLEWALDMT